MVITSSCQRIAVVLTRCRQQNTIVTLSSYIKKNVNVQFKKRHSRDWRIPEPLQALEFQDQQIISYFDLSAFLEALNSSVDFLAIAG
ncbi:MAG: hypothetical protein ACFFD4_17925 [Candidatus Odinarchaeota archaeon]